MNLKNNLENIMADASRKIKENSVEYRGNFQDSDKNKIKALGGFLGHFITAPLGPAFSLACFSYGCLKIYHVYKDIGAKNGR